MSEVGMLRERVEFLERANAKLGEDWRAMRIQMGNVETFIGGLHGRPFDVVVIEKIKSLKERAERVSSRGRKRFARDAMLQFSPDTGAITDDVFEELMR